MVPVSQAITDQETNRVIFLSYLTIYSLSAVKIAMTNIYNKTKRFAKMIIAKRSSQRLWVYTYTANGTVQ